jgi:hypothetical protein
MKAKLLLVSLIISNSIIAQISSSSGYYNAKEYSKEISLYRAKAFVMADVLLPTENVVQFEIDPLAATSSGEVTSLFYKCKEKNKEGLVLGFYGNYWNKAGALYQGYGFKNLPKDNALELLNKITQTIEEQRKFLDKDQDNNNVYFRYDDLVILIYTLSIDPRIRIFWQDFDAEWQITAFKRTKKRFERSLD